MSQASDGELHAEQGDKLKYSLALLSLQGSGGQKGQEQSEGPLAEADQGCGRALKPSFASLGLETSSGTDRPLDSTLEVLPRAQRLLLQDSTPLLPDQVVSC